MADNVGYKKIKKIKIKIKWRMLNSILVPWVGPLPSDRILVGLIVASPPSLLP